MQDTGTTAPPSEAGSIPPLGDMMVAFVLIASAVAMFVAASDVRGANEHEPLGPALMPRLFAGTILVGALIVFLRAAVVWRRDRRPVVPRGASTRSSAQRVAQVAVMLGLICAYALAMPWIGYLPSTTAFGTAAMACFGSRRWGGLIVFPVLAALGLYALFTYGLDVRLP